ncbi:MAG: hypothetical protein V3U84_09890 [Thiotrichaceae bacterium]
MSFKNTKKFIILSGISLLITMSNVATAKPENGGKGGHRGPPPEAIEACADKSETESCNFITPRDDKIEGTCIIPPHDRAELICAPEGGPPHHGGEPEE